MSMMERVKDFIGITDLEEDYEEEEVVSEGTDRNRNERMETYTKRNNVIKVHSNTDMKVFICEPEKYEDCTKAVDEIKNRKVVVLNIEGMELEDQKQVFEFIKGAVYALEASIQKVSNGIFVLAPNNVQIDGRLSDRYERNYYYGK
ncbi:MAG: cell division protein SepF [Tissierellia bacterium]|jgi:cell division inhibitor SepF|nr:cell division protein SepF [Tissierellia bacterium]MDD3226881.1 cell division protein SepF [Tissierellia bacterium]MDD3751084.1 cell division protein SepF [Tissierellia bacterium]MDD4045953.1 cell division protein SepF [Tissierellia bacterium]MDD4678054.1 cell division protein SepF [Tissierellia bacterium]